MAVSGMSLLWLQPMSTIVTGGREGALACESCVSFVTFLALSSSFVVFFTLLTNFGTSLFGAVPAIIGMSEELRACERPCSALWHTSTNTRDV